MIMQHSRIALGLIALVVSLRSAAAVESQEVEPQDVGFTGKIIPGEKVVTASDPNTTTPGDLYVEPSTLRSLGFEWNIARDDDRDGRVAVRYRKKGTPDWREALDLLRIQGEGLAKI